jgi:hypothetical protein
VITVLITLLMWVAAIDRIRKVWKHSNSVNFGYCVAAVGVAGAFSMKLIEQPTDDWLGPYVSDLMKHFLIVVGGCGAEILLLGLRSNDLGPSPREIANKIRIALVVSIVMCAAFVVAPIHAIADHGDLDVVFDHVAAVAFYRLVFNIYIAYVLIGNYRLCRRYVSVEDDVGVRLSTWLVGAGSLVALGYSISRFIFVGYVYAGNSSPSALDTLGSALAAFGLLCMALGILAPRVAHRRRDLGAAMDKIRRITPLWTDLTRVCPSVILPTSPPWTVERALHRCNRYLTEVGESLLLVRVSDLTAQRIRSSRDQLGSLAAGLFEERDCWLTAGGPLAGQLFPATSDTTQYERAILDLGDAYRSCAWPPPQAVLGKRES